VPTATPSNDSTTADRVRTPDVRNTSVNHSDVTSSGR
jgi:hypothetical protein